LHKLIAIFANALTATDDIRASIAEYGQAKILWVDTEIADFLTRNPRLSLIQVLDDPSDQTGENVSILDVLDQPEVVDIFIDKSCSTQRLKRSFTKPAMT